MREQFELELQQLEQQLLALGQAVLAATSKSLLALAARDHEMASRMIEEDHTINQAQLDIELACARLLALQQPQATDLRFVLVVMSASSDLERMADHMVSLSRAVLRLKATHQLSDHAIAEQVHALGQKAQQQLAQLLAVMSSHDTQKAIALAKEDKQIDDQYKTLSRDMMTLMKAQTIAIYQGTEYLSMLKHIERFADDITSICERLVYLETGEIISLTDT